LGVASVVVGGVAFVLILLAQLLNEGATQKLRQWIKGHPPSEISFINDLYDYNGGWDGVEAAYPEVRELRHQVVPRREVSTWIAGVAVLAVLAGLIMASVSFASDSKRHWKIAGCVVNGLLLFWVLLRMGMLLPAR
jgi:hypothetical protein